MREPVDLRRLLLSLAGSPLPFSDIHIEEEQPLVVKMPGAQSWTPIDAEGNLLVDDYGTPTPEAPGALILTLDEIKLLLDVLEPNWKSLFETGHVLSLPVVLSDVRMRCNAYPIKAGRRSVVSVRRQPKVPPTPEEIGIPPHVVKATERAKGLILVTGPTGAGKTTTIFSLLNHINETRGAHIITIEKPIEYELERKRSIISQKEVGRDTESFTAGLEEGLQQRPTVILIGEIRDKNAAESTLLAAESGHLVFATMHSSSAEGALSKLLSFFPGEAREAYAHVLANNLLAVIGQNLAAIPDKVGVQMVAEILMNSSTVGKALTEPGGLPRIREIMKMDSEKENCLMNNVLIQMIKDKKIDMREALRVSYDPVPLQELIIRSNR